MPDKTATGIILIIKMPSGEAPEHIRMAWIGLELPCHPKCGYSPEGDRGALTGSKLQLGHGRPKEIHSRNGFSVPQDMALEILERNASEAARWWRNRGFPHAGKCFGFAEDEAQIVSGVTHQRIILVEDDMQGDPYR